MAIIKNYNSDQVRYMIKYHILERCRQLIADSGKSMRQVSYDLYMDPSNMTRFLNGKHNVNVMTLACLLDSLGYHLEIKKNVCDHKCDTCINEPICYDTDKKIN